MRKVGPLIQYLAVSKIQGFRKGYSFQSLKLVAIALLLAVICPILSPSGVFSESEAALWKALRSGKHFALLRHAIAPGMGDPPWFELGKCTTQRNLSYEGQSQAEKIGERFRANRISQARVFSSQWCRCLETAKLLGIGPVQELPALDSFYRAYKRRDSQTQILKEWIAGQDLDQPLVLVTHQVNISALTNIYPASGELVIVHRSESGEFSVLGTIETD